MQSEPATLVHMPEDCGTTIHQPSLPPIVMDAGLASNDNIAWLIEQGYHYLVVGRERKRQALSLLSFRAENEKRAGGYVIASLRASFVTREESRGCEDYRIEVIVGDVYKHYAIRNDWQYAPDSPHTRSNR